MRDGCEAMVQISCATYFPFSIEYISIDLLVHSGLHYFNFKINILFIELPEVFNVDVYIFGEEVFIPNTSLKHAIIFSPHSLH